MAAPRKFGTFGGVFTPAILTILGVIMYLRLPWIVGNAGMWLAMGVVVVAHVVSVSTGLSVSSIATDKKVKAGGSYYIISRSLGLAIGGTLGIALFVGLSFSVSLYLIGFSESLLTTILEREPTVDEIRLAGSAALMTVTIVTFISTALAIKTQYIIMTLIGLSLVSLLVGNSDMAAPTMAHLEPMAEGASLAVIFGIFFPAVTGFEAGVSMSGDLKDPKGSIPKGTLSAIAVGLIVYLAMSAFLAHRIPADQLANNKAVLLDYSWIPGLVLGGIWGATISSAFGSILGAPRILQACAEDRIGPRWFAKGAGKDNEPRNALMLTFVIAEGGILIGELDAIARVVSMFFLASYAFLNVAAAIESWASPDFRPDFRIPRWVSVVGAVTCTFLMIQLDFVAMVGAVAALSGLFVWLKSKQLALEGGDTWTGVWSSLVRSGLDRLSRSSTHQRNWRPNVLCFTDGSAGPSGGRDGVIELGRSICHVRGVLSEFELVGAEDPTLAPARDEAIDDEARPIGVFHRRLETDDHWDTIGSIARYHGMTGLEPNSVMVPWALLKGRPERAADLLSRFTSLDLNVVVPINPRPVAAGRHLDVWWRGSGRNLALQLALVRFITGSEQWRQATVRFLAITADPALKRTLEQRLARFLDDGRQEAEVRVLLPPEDGDLEDFIMRTSAEADLTIVGMRAGIEDDAESLSAAIETIATTRQSALLVRAASAFADPFPDLDARSLLRHAQPAELGPRPPRERPKTLDLHDEDAGMARHSLQLHDGLADAWAAYHAEVAQRMSEHVAAVVARIEGTVERSLGQVERASTTNPLARRRRMLTRVVQGTIEAVDKDLTELSGRLLEDARETLDVGLAALAERLRETLEGCAEEVTVDPPEGEEWRGFWGRLFRRPNAIQVPLRDFARGLLELRTGPAIDGSLERMASGLNTSLRGLDGLVSSALAALEKAARRVATLEEGADSGVDAEIEAFGARVAGWRREEELRLTNENEIGSNFARDTAQQVADLLADPRGKTAPRTRLAPEKSPLDPDVAVEGHFSEFELQAHVLRRTMLDVALRRLHQRVRAMEDKALAEMTGQIERGVLADVARFEGDLETLAEALAEDPRARLHLTARMDARFDERRVTSGLLEGIETATDRLPEAVETLAEASFTALEEGRYDEVEPVNISVRRLVSFVLETDFAGALGDQLGKLGRAVERLGNAARDVLRLVSFDELDPDGDLPPDIAEERLELVESARERLRSERKQVEQAWEAMKEALPERVTAVVERTEGGAIHQSAGQLKRFMKTYERERFWSRLGDVMRTMQARVRRLLIDMSYRWSRGVLLARQLRREEEAPAPPVEQVLELRREAAPAASVQDALPIFYRQIFLGRAADDPAYWLSQDEELARAGRAVESHRGGHPGALLVTGPPGSGRAALVQRICQTHFDRDKTFVVRAPEGGCVEVARFERAILGALGVQTGVAHALETAPDGSAVVIPNIELWWERRPGGMVVIDRLAALIDQFGGRCLFVLSCSEAVIGLLGRLGRLEGQLLATVPCRALDALELREAIMVRHRATGMGLRLEGDKGEPSEWQMARLFAGVFDYSGGFVGSALGSWIAHIQAVDGDAIVMRKPRQMELTSLHSLDDDWMSLLVELVLHRQLTLERLRRVTGRAEDELKRTLTALERAGLVTRSTSGTGAIELDRWLRPHLLRYLNQREVL